MAPAATHHTHTLTGKPPRQTLSSSIHSSLGLNIHLAPMTDLSQKHKYNNHSNNKYSNDNNNGTNNKNNNTA